MTFAGNVVVDVLVDGVFVVVFVCCVVVFVCCVVVFACCGVVLVCFVVGPLLVHVTVAFGGAVLVDECVVLVVLVNCIVAAALCDHVIAGSVGSNAYALLMVDYNFLVVVFVAVLLFLSVVAVALVLDVDPVHVGHASAVQPVPVCIQADVIVGYVVMLAVLVKVVNQLVDTENEQQVVFVFPDVDSLDEKADTLDVVVNESPLMSILERTGSLVRGILAGTLAVCSLMGNPVTPVKGLSMAVMGSLMDSLVVRD